MSIDAAVPESDAPSGVSRRGLIRNTAGVGAAGLAAGVLLSAGAGPAQAAEVHTAEPAANEHAPAHTETLIVHVLDARTGELEIHHGKAHRTVYDRKLTSALLHAAG